MPSQYSFELATRPETVAACQRLRYRVFALELGASLESAAEQVDADPYDPFCRHLAVRARAGGAVVACTRILSDQDAAGTGGFYAQTEFDLGRLHALPGRKLEIGRTCVHPDHRGGGAIACLWQGLAGFMLGERYDYLFGCASVDMRDGGRQARLIYRRARERGQVNDSLGIAPRVPLPAAGAPAAAPPIGLNASVRRLLPPLLKAYLNLGAEICGAPAWDRRFNVADMFVLVDRAHIAPRYARRFLRPPGRRPAASRPPPRAADAAAGARWCRIAPLGHAAPFGARQRMLFGKAKEHKCTIANTGQTFTVPPKMNLLQAARNAGIEWPCDCKVGSCGTCRCILKEGKVKPLNDFAYVLDGEMLKQGYVLACQAQLKSDLVVEVDFEQGALENVKLT